jgi:hypothetical protein
VEVGGINLKYLKMETKITKVNYTCKCIELTVGKGNDDLRIEVRDNTISLVYFNIPIVSFKFRSVQIPYKNGSINIDMYIKMLIDLKADSDERIVLDTTFYTLDLNLYDLVKIKLLKDVNTDSEPIKIVLMNSNGNILFEDDEDDFNVSDKLRLMNKVINDTIIDENGSKNK